MAEDARDASFKQIAVVAWGAHIKEYRLYGPDSGGRVYQWSEDIKLWEPMSKRATGKSRP